MFLLFLNVFFWSDVDYFDVFISCLDSHSDGTHSLQRIHWWDSDGMLHFSKSVLMKKNLSTSMMAWGWVRFQEMFIFGWTIALTCSICRPFTGFGAEPLCRSGLSREMCLQHVTWHFHLSCRLYVCVFAIDIFWLVWLWNEQGFIF